MSALNVPSQQSRAIGGVPFVGQPFGPGTVVRWSTDSSGLFIGSGRTLTRILQNPNDPYVQCFYSDNSQLYCQAATGGCCDQDCCTRIVANSQLLVQTAAYNDPHAENIGMGAVWVVVAMGIFVFLFALALLGWFIANKVRSSKEEKQPTYVSYQGSSIAPAESRIQDGRSSTVPVLVYP